MNKKNLETTYENFYAINQAKIVTGLSNIAMVPNQRQFNYHPSEIRI
jgi:hypothetical protein